MKNLTLWQRLAAFEFDKGQPRLCFAERLARENGWSSGFAQRVLAEYRRFIYLAAAAGHPVSPSDEVDQAWHLHLVYTRSYWDDLCGQVLGKPIHHGPTAGGDEEDAKFHAWYEATLRSYEEEFGTPPPKDIWPSAAQRFAPNKHQRVNLSTHCLLPRLAWQRWVTPAAAVLAALLLMPGCDADINLPFGFLGFLLLILAMIVISNLRSPRRGRSGDGGSSCGASSSSLFHSPHYGSDSDSRFHHGGSLDNESSGGGSSGCGGGDSSGGGGCGGGGCGGGGD